MKRSPGSRLIQSLATLLDALKNSEDLAKRFKVHAVHRKTGERIDVSKRQG